MKKALLSGLLLVATMSVFTIGCKKDKVDDDDIQSAQDNSLSENIYSDVKTMADEAQNGSTSSFRSPDATAILGTCSVVTVDSVSTPHKITINFPDATCVCKDGKTRSGSIIVTYNGKFRATGTKISVTFDNYIVNGNKVSGTKEWTNMGTVNGYTTYNIVVAGNIIKADGTSITWNSTRTWQWVKGENTPLNRLDDEYVILSGSSITGSNSNGGQYTATVTKDLLRRVLCHQFVSGTIDFVPNSKPVRVIDFGNGDCDDVATITVNGKTRTVNIK